MSTCPNGHNPATITYDANGWRRWCGRCGALMTDATGRAPRPSAARAVFVGMLKLLAGTATAISLIVAALLGAALIVYLLSLLVR